MQFAGPKEGKFVNLLGLSRSQVWRRSTVHSLLLDLGATLFTGAMTAPWCRVVSPETLQNTGCCLRR